MLKKTRIKLILEIACSSNLNRWNKFLKEFQYYRYNLLFLFSFFFVWLCWKKNRIGRNNDVKILKIESLTLIIKCVNTSISCLIIATYTLYKWLKVQIYAYEWSIVPDFNLIKIKLHQQIKQMAFCTRNLNKDLFFVFRTCSWNQQIWGDIMTMHRDPLVVFLPHLASQYLHICKHLQLICQRVSMITTSKLFKLKYGKSGSAYPISRMHAPLQVLLHMHDLHKFIIDHVRISLIWITAQKADTSVFGSSCKNKNFYQKAMESFYPFSSTFRLLIPAWYNFYSWLLFIEHKILVISMYVYRNSTETYMTTF